MTHANVVWRLALSRGVTKSDAGASGGGFAGTAHAKGNQQECPHSTDVGIMHAHAASDMVLGLSSFSNAPFILWQAIFDCKGACEVHCLHDVVAAGINVLFADRGKQGGGGLVWEDAVQPSRDTE